MNDKAYLLRAIKLAERSSEKLPCASILLDEKGTVVAAAYNSQRRVGRTAAHAEMKAIDLANAARGRDLRGLTAYGNCEPCTMCLSAMIFAGISRIVFATRLNDLLEDGDKIDIDCFEFVSKFPNPPILEHIPF